MKLISDRKHKFSKKKKDEQRKDATTINRNIGILIENYKPSVTQIRKYVKRYNIDELDIYLKHKRPTTISETKQLLKIFVILFFAFELVSEDKPVTYILFYSIVLFFIYLFNNFYWPIFKTKMTMQICK